MCSMHNANTILLIVLGYTCTEIITKLWFFFQWNILVYWLCLELCSNNPKLCYKSSKLSWWYIMIWWFLSLSLSPLIQTIGILSWIALKTKMRAFEFVHLSSLWVWQTRRISMILSGISLDTLILQRVLVSTYTLTIQSVHFVVVFRDIVIEKIIAMCSYKGYAHITNFEW